MPGSSSQGIFLSYRREDGAPYARLLQHDLHERFRDTQVFMDLDSIEPGLDFAQVIEDAVNSCVVLVALIGRQWATLTAEDGGRRLDNPDDFVRFEVKTALDRGVRVIPVLIDGARLLRQQDLPADLYKLARLNAHKLSYDRYQDDTDRLLDLIQRVLAEATALAEADRTAWEAERATQAEAELRDLRENAISTEEEKDALLRANILTGHIGKVYCVAFSPDGRLLASGSKDKTVRLWDPASGEHRHILIGHARLVCCVAFSPDGRLLASGSEDKTVRVWDPASGEHLRTLTGAGGKVNSVAFSPDGRLLASGSDDRTVRLWDPASGEHLRTLTGLDGEVNSVAFSPDGRLLASGSDENAWMRPAEMTVRLWDPISGEHLRTLTVPVGRLLDHNVHSVAFSPDGHLLASSFVSGVRLWDPARGELRRNLTGDADQCKSVAFSPDGHLLASSGWSRTVRLWDPASGKHLCSLTGHAKWVNSVAFSPDGQLLASGSDDKTVRLWELTADQQVAKRPLPASE